MWARRCIALAAAAFAATVSAELTLSRVISQSPCVRLLRSGGQIGCSSSAAGDTGFLFAVSNGVDFDAFTQLQTAEKWVVMLPPEFLTLPYVQQLVALPHFAGIVALPGPRGSSWSPAPKELPRGLDPEYTWNPYGLELIFSDFPFPMVAIDDVEAARLLPLAAHNAGKGWGGSGQGTGTGGGFPAYALHIDAYMGPSNLDSLQCLDSGSCLPLGGQSVWGSLGPLDSAPAGSSAGGIPDPRSDAAGDNAPKQRPVVMAISPMDAAALFHDLAFGADAAVSSMAAMLGAAEALSHTDAARLPLQILFGVFQAEAWGRVGSRRWVSEVRDFACAQNVSAKQSPTGRAYCARPLRTDLSFSALSLSDIAYVLAVDQVGGLDQPTFYVHEQNTRPGGGPGGGGPGAWITSVLAALRGLSVTVEQAMDTAAPPPTPLLSFQDSGTNLQLDGAVLSEYNGAFSSRFYFSRFDNSSNVAVSTVTAAATTLAKGLYALAANKTTAAEAAAAVPDSLEANATLVREIVECITVNPRCDLFQRVLSVDADTLAALVAPQPLSLYTGVYRQPQLLPNNGFVLQPTPIEAFVRNSLAFYSATERNGTCSRTSDCQSGSDKRYECLQGECVIANAFYHDALSPALATTDTAGAYIISRSTISDADPLWTEPYWSASIGGTVFLKDGPAAEYGTLGAGLATTLLSIPAFAYLVRMLDAAFYVP